MKYLITILLLSYSTMAIADQYSSDYPDVMGHMTLRRPTDNYVPRELVVTPERYDPNQFRNDPTVLVSLAKPRPVEVVQTKEIPPMENKQVVEINIHKSDDTTQAVWSTKEE